MYVRDILQDKGSNVVTIGPGETVRAASKALAKARIGALPVLDEGRLVGIISERDITYALAETDVGTGRRKVSEIMSGKLRTCTPDSTVAECLGMMTERRIRHLPVLRDGHLVGVVSIGDLVKRKLDEIQAEARQLREFIQT